ncbi:MAG: DUF6807 family protein [Gemmataceae bacterium]
MRLVFACLLAALTAGASVADDAAPTVTVTGGDHDLTNVVVRAPLPDGALPGIDRVRLTDGSKVGTAVGQIAAARLLATPAGQQEPARELTFIVPRLSAGQTKTFFVISKFGENGALKRFNWQDAPGDHADLLWGSQPTMRYMYKALDESSKEAREQTFKVYHHLFDRSGETLITKGPGGLYTHHRGLFFGFNKVTYEGKKADVWHCTGDAYQSHEGFGQRAAGELFGRHRVKVAWHGEQKHTFALEERELTCFMPLDDGLLVEFASVLRPTTDKVRLDGDPQHSGFHVRVSNEVAEQFQAKKPQTYFLRPDGKGAVGEERNWDPKTKKGPVNLPWDAMCFELGGKRYTLVYLDRPENPKESRGSERVYGRVGNYFEYDLTADKPLRLNYRVWLQEGEMTGEQCEALHRSFTEPVKVAVK